MSRFVLHFRWFFAVLALSGMLGPAAIAAQPNSLKLTIAFTEEVVVLGTFPCFMQGTIVGTGQAPRLGRLTLSSTDCINPTDPQNPTTFLFTSNKVVLTAPNGDQIFAEYIGTLNFESSIGEMAGGFIITGGNGRFANATGGGSIKGVEQMNGSTGTGQVQLTGTITF